ncbi:MAG: hypothetical protein M1815_004462 [Lichina confinis]|nr:MAG: hypothetical protein M1815_004462 [Lichina confinis]
MSFHGSCSGCHHFFKRFPVHFDPSARPHGNVGCPKCGKRLFVLGDNASHDSLASQLTLCRRDESFRRAGPLPEPGSAVLNGLMGMLGPASLGIIHAPRYPSGRPGVALSTYRASVEQSRGMCPAAVDFLGRGHAGMASLSDHCRNPTRTIGSWTSAATQLLKSLKVKVAQTVPTSSSMQMQSHVPDGRHSFQLDDADLHTRLGVASDHYLSTEGGSTSDPSAEVTDYDADNPSDQTRQEDKRSALLRHRQMLTNAAQAPAQSCPSGHACNCATSSGGGDSQPSMSHMPSLIGGYAPGYTDRGDFPSSGRQACMRAFREDSCSSLHLREVGGWIPEGFLEDKRL